MAKISLQDWQSALVEPQSVIEKIRPGMSIFLGTAVAEPRTMVRHLMTSGAKNLEDLELIQLVSVGDAVSLQTLQSQNFRLKTFFHGWVADEAIEAGRVDLIPSRFVKIPQLIESLLRPIDVAIIQVTPPNEAGFCSLGIAVDVAREALEQASIRVGEINPLIPRTFGDTFVQATEFDFLVRAADPPVYFDRWEKTGGLVDRRRKLPGVFHRPALRGPGKKADRQASSGHSFAHFHGPLNGFDDQRERYQPAQGNLPRQGVDILCHRHRKLDGLAGQQSAG
jgi:hypothetical protein